MNDKTEPVLPSPARGGAGVPRLVLVTGTSSGIGRAVTEDLAARGTTVLAGVRAAADAERWRAHGSGRVVPITLDVTDAAQLAAAGTAVAERARALGLAGLDGLVANAGISVSWPLEPVPLAELRRQLEVNVVGQVGAMQAVIAPLRAARGRIVLIGSMAGYMANPFQGPYAASKHALEAVADSLRRELRPAGVAVSLIEPGAIASEIWVKGERAGRDMLERVPEDARAYYGPAAERVLERVAGIRRNAAPAERVAAAVVDALTAARPRTRYRVGRDAAIGRALTWLLPDRVIDAIVARGTGLR